MVADGDDDDRIASQHEDNAEWKALQDEVMTGRCFTVQEGDSGLRPTGRGEPSLR